MAGLLDWIENAATGRLSSDQVAAIQQQNRSDVTKAMGSYVPGTGLFSGDLLSLGYTQAQIDALRNDYLAGGDALIVASVDQNGGTAEDYISDTAADLAPSFALAGGGLIVVVIVGLVIAWKLRLI
jgi:hypothetical protein